jgi:hypothetical protein
MEMMKKALVSALFLFPAAGLSQEGSDLKRLKEEVEVLKEELRKLRLEISAPEVTEYRSYTGLGPAASKALINPKGVSIGGYGEVWFTWNPERRPVAEFDTFRFIIYLGYAFTERLKFNSEIEIEHAFVEGGEESGEVALEFAFIDYRVNKLLGLRGGMVLIPVGITNEYHEPPTYFSVKQPYLEKTLFPFTWRENGAGLYGDFGFGEYRFYIVNGLKAKKGSYSLSNPLKKLRQKGSEAAADQLAFTGRIDFRLPYNLTVGLSTFISGVQNAQGEALGTVSLFSPHLWWQYAGFDVRVVGALTQTSGADRISAELDDGSGAQEVFPVRMDGFYAQVAYNILRFADTDQELFLFVKYEDLRPYAEVPSGYSAPAGKNFKVYNAGISYKPHPLVALKADVAQIDREGPAKDETVYATAITWMF